MSNNDRHVEEALQDALRTAETVTSHWDKDSGTSRAQEPVQQGSGAARTIPQAGSVSTLVPQDRQLREDDGPMVAGPYEIGQLVSVLPERHGPVWVGSWQGLMVNGTAVVRHEQHGYRLYVPADGLGRIMAAA